MLPGGNAPLVVPRATGPVIGDLHPPGSKSLTQRWLLLAALDARFMLRDRPGIFAAGEMLDWEAPTGGYLLQACFATGRAAALGLLGWLQEGR
jgi:hypothetical protein